VLEAKEQAYKTELAVLKQGPQLDLQKISNPTIILQQTKEELEGDIQQYSTAVLGLQTDIDRLNSELKQHQQTYDELVHLDSSFTEKLENQTNSSSNTTAKESLAQDNYDILDKDETELRQELTNFLRNQFAVAPTTTPANSGKRKIIQCITLEEMMDELFRRQDEHPKNPYVKIEERHHPDYVNLLLRSKVIQFHPQNTSMMRLVDLSEEGNPS